MHKKIILLVSLISILTVSCKKQPNACMEISETAVSTGVPVEFTSCSENALSLSWYFAGPDGSPEISAVSSDIKFTHSFTTPGVYKVRLFAYSEFSFEGEASLSIQEIVVY